MGIRYLFIYINLPTNNFEVKEMRRVLSVCMYFDVHVHGSLLIIMNLSHFAWIFLTFVYFI